MITHAADNDFNRALSIVLNTMAADGWQKRILDKWGCGTTVKRRWCAEPNGRCRREAEWVDI